MFLQSTGLKPRAVGPSALKADVIKFAWYMARRPYLGKAGRVGGTASTSPNGSAGMVLSSNISGVFELIPFNLQSGTRSQPHTHSEDFMRIQRLLAGIASTFTLLLVTTQAALAQDPPLKVEVTTAPTTTVWYADPLWIGVGVVAALFVIVLIVLAARGGGKSSTTVVR